MTNEEIKNRILMEMNEELTDDELRKLKMCLERNFYGITVVDNCTDIVSVENISNEKMISKFVFEQKNKYDFKIKEMEVDKDHIHMMINSVPKISPLQIVRVLKQQSTIEIWKMYRNELKKQYWIENIFWADGYFCSTIGEVSSETLKHYIQNQG